MEMRGYPLHMMQGYVVPLDEMLRFLEQISAKDLKEPAFQIISKHRRALLPFGAIAMKEVLSAMNSGDGDVLRARGSRRLPLFDAFRWRTRSRPAARGCRRTGDPSCPLAGACPRTCRVDRADDAVLRRDRDGRGEPLPPGRLPARRYQLARASGLPRSASAERDRAFVIRRHHPCRPRLYRAYQLLSLRGP